MNGLTKVPLGDVLRVKHGYAFPGAGFGEDPASPQVLTPGNFSIGGGFKKSKPKSFAGDYPVEYALSAGDLIVSMTDLSKSGDTLGLPARVPEGDMYLHNQRIGLVEVIVPELVTTSFLNYFLRTDSYRSYVLGTASGSTVRHTSPGRIQSYIASLPSLGTQQAIAKVLGALDDKIAANVKLAELAFKLSKAIYAEAKGGSTASEPLGLIATTVLGGTPSRARPELWTNGTVPWLNSGKANEERIVSPSELITAEALSGSATKMMPAGATIIAITGATLGQVARLEINACGNQSLVGIWSESASLNDWLHFAIRDRIPELLKKATGAAQQHVNKRDVDALEVPVLGDADLPAFHGQVGPLLAAAANADWESAALAELRDALIPELMSGRLRVKDAEKKIEEVV